MPRSPSVRETLPAERPSDRTVPEGLSARRAAVAGMPTDPGPGVDLVDRPVGQVPCRTVSVPRPVRTILYLHGGGYRMGSAAGWSRFAGKLALAADASVVLVDYRLAPEHPFPAALHDAAAVYDELQEPARSGDHGLFLAGDSAGAGLAAALALAATAAGAPLPDGLVLLSPWLDLGCGSETFASRAGSDPLFPLESAREAAEQYLQGHPVADPLASPSRAEDAALPPTLVLTSADETLLGDALDLVRSLADRRCRVALEVVPGMLHAWPAVQPDTADADAAMRRIGAFLSEHAPTRST